MDEGGTCAPWLTRSDRQLEAHTTCRHEYIPYTNMCVIATAAFQFPFRVHTWLSVSA